MIPGKRKDVVYKQLAPNLGYRYVSGAFFSVMVAEVVQTKEP
jgi:hypothetical protein